MSRHPFLASVLFAIVTLLVAVAIGYARTDQARSHLHGSCSSRTSNCQTTR